MRLLPTIGLLAAFAAAQQPVAPVAPAVHQEARQALVEDLTACIRRELADKQLPAICIALLDVEPQTGAEWGWQAGFGHADRDGRHPVGADAVHRVASISKLFTATAAMVLAERGALDLDAPVVRWLPEFRPQGAGGEAITLRQLLGHRAGIVRESPIGHYFDAGEPSLAATVLSLNQTALVHAPGSRFKYSNPGIGVVGAAVAAASGRRFEDAVRELVLEPLGMRDSSFDERADLVARTPFGAMWTIDGRSIPTPDFAFGYGPAANLRSTVGDLVQFARSWFPHSKQRVLSVGAQAAMWAVPPTTDSGKRECGLGFFVNRLDGHLRVSHGGAVYGFASTLTALPEQGLAVAVVTTVDFGNEVSDWLGRRALRGMLAARAGERLPAPPRGRPVGVDRARALAGRYRLKGEWFDLYERGGELRFDPCIGVGSRHRQLGEKLVSDDRMSMGGRRLVAVRDGVVNDGVADFARDETRPQPAPAAMLAYLGEYGWDHNRLIVYEDDGRLGVVIEWLVRDLLDPVGDDLFRFPAGMYGGDLLRFERDGGGAVVAAHVGGARFARVPDPPPGGYRIAPRRPVPELREQHRGAVPPAQQAGLRAPDLVDLEGLDATLKFDIKYAGADNFLGTPVYERARPRMQRPAAEALLAVHRSLREHGYGLLVFDAYRPWSVTKLFYEATPDEQRHFVADPGQGSRHNRGCAVDLTLYDLASGRAVEMPSGFDEFTERAYPDWPGSTRLQRWHRELLRTAMERGGFAVYEHEWWHFDFKDWREYPILNEPL